MNASSPAARRYARALYDIGRETNSLEVLVNELRRVAETLEGSAELRAALENPVVVPSARKAIMDEVTKRLALSGMGRNAVLLMTDRGRAGLIPAVVDALAQMVDERAGRLRAEVTSAQSLSDAQYTKLQATLEKLTGHKITLARKTDPGLIAGVVVRVGDKLFDGSARSQLVELKRSLLPS